MNVGSRLWSCTVVFTFEMANFEAAVAANSTKPLLHVCVAVCRGMEHTLVCPHVKGVGLMGRGAGDRVGDGVREVHGCQWRLSRVGSLQDAKRLAIARCPVPAPDMAKEASTLSHCTHNRAT